MTKVSGINVNSGYYTLNDKKLLVDGVPHSNNADIDLVRPRVSLEEQSSLAIEKVEERISELRKGQIKLNYDDDNKKWNELGIAAEYIFERHPLIKEFMKSDGEQ